MNIGNDCVIGAKTNLYGPENIPPNTLIINSSRFQKNSFESSHEKHLEYLHGILPKCHETFHVDH